jgi:thiamine pyrophosphate-dependent acetolactate synthase large subunit-like protein
LSGGHLFPLYDGAQAAGIRLIDVRHESSAAFAAEGWARLGRCAGVAAVTAGPGVFNAVTGLASAARNGSPVLLLGGRAPAATWGLGALQEIDHVPVAAPLTKHAGTVAAAAAAEVGRALALAMAAPRGPVFLDIPVDLPAEEPAPLDVQPPVVAAPDPAVVAGILASLATARRPVLVAGSNVYLDGAWEHLQAFAETAGVPVFMNGMGRGVLPADHPLAFSRTRGRALGEADLIIVAGTPLDFRLSYGWRFCADAVVVHLDSHPSLVAGDGRATSALGADLAATFGALAEGATRAADGDWASALRAEEDVREREAGEGPANDDGSIHPQRLYAELRRFLDRDAVVIGDGGDFVSWAGREIRSYVPGAWLDPGPLGSLGCGPGYAIAAKLLHPSRQVVLLLGDGSFGFAGMEIDTMVRHGLAVVCIVGNNGAWGLERTLMRELFGYDLVADLRQETRYDLVAVGLGAHGELVRSPGDIAPALERAFAAGVPSVLNVLLDPEATYPRSTGPA